MNDAIRILIVDDHFMVRMGLASTLNDEDDMQVVGEASTAKEAVQRYRQLLPDVTLMDLRLPDADGSSAIRTIREQFSSARILVLSVNQSEEDICESVEAGAMGYLPKSVEPRDLLQAVRSLHQGKQCFPPDIASRITEREKRPKLTPREQQVIELLVKGLSNKEIARALDISPRTAKLHVCNVLDKMDVLDRTQAVTAAIQRGLVQLE